MPKLIKALQSLTSLAFISNVLQLLHHILLLAAPINGRAHYDVPENRLIIINNRDVDCEDLSAFACCVVSTSFSCTDSSALWPPEAGKSWTTVFLFTMRQHVWSGKLVFRTFSLLAAYLARGAQHRRRRQRIAVLCAHFHHFSFARRRYFKKRKVSLLRGHGMSRRHASRPPSNQNVYSKHASPLMKKNPIPN